MEFTQYAISQANAFYFIKNLLVGSYSTLTAGKYNLIFNVKLILIEQRVCSVFQDDTMHAGHLFLSCDVTGDSLGTLSVFHDFRCAAMSEKLMISPLAHTVSQPRGRSLLCMPQAHLCTHACKAFMEIHIFWAIYRNFHPFKSCTTVVSSKFYFF